jgi:hypothetical protein
MKIKQMGRRWASHVPQVNVEIMNRVAIFSFLQNQIPKLAEKTENNDTQTTKQEAKNLAVLQTGMIPLLRKGNHSLLTTTVDNTLHY